MADQTVAPPVQMTLCRACAYWTTRNQQNGLCRRHAPHPRPDDRSDWVSHWPETMANEGCGEGTDATQHPNAKTACGKCAFWYSTGAGIVPVNKADSFAAYWRTAGKCRRPAPVPIKDPGPRGNWAVVSAEDSCGDGALRADAP